MSTDFPRFAASVFLVTVKSLVEKTICIRAPLRTLCLQSATEVLHYQARDDERRDKKYYGEYSCTNVSIVPGFLSKHIQNTDNVPQVSLKAVSVSLNRSTLTSYPHLNVSGMMHT